MKKLLLSVVALLCAITTMAQPSPMDVEPGTLGVLPAVPVIDTTVPANQFNGLEVDQVSMSSVIFNGSFSFEIWMKFPIASTLGGEYYTLEYKDEAEWKTYSTYEGDVHFTYDNATIYIYGLTYYRLRMHGGDMDGWTSNIVSAKRPNGACPTSRGGYAISGQDYFTLVGREQMNNFNFSVTSYDGYSLDKIGTFDQDSEYLRFQWYRRNPYNWDMTPIAGATMLRYTPVIEDAGYQLVLEISGDEKHCSFVYMFPLDVVKLPVYSSVSYYGNDGFVLNTEYVLTDPAKQLVMQEEWDGDMAPLPASIVERKPGQYAVHCTPEEYEWWYLLDVAGDGYQLIFKYLVDQGDETMLWVREAQLMADRWMAPLTVKTRRAGKSVPADIEVYGPNIDGDWVVKAKATIDAQADSVMFDREAGLFSIGEGYVLKAIPADASLAATYFPNTTSWSSAKRVMPGEEYDWDSEDYIIATYTIDVQEASGETPAGDVNGDFTTDVADIANVIDVMAKENNDPRADVNKDGTVDVADIAAIINIMAK